MAVSQLKAKTRPSSFDLQTAIQEVHDCLHRVAEDVRSVKEDVADVRERVASVEGFQSGIAARLRVPAAGETMSLWARFKTPIVVAGAIFTTLTAFVAFYPTLRAVLAAVDAVLTAHP